jgi:hypothetical protein
MDTGMAKVDASIQTMNNVLRNRQPHKDNVHR